MAVERYRGEWAREILGLPEIPEEERSYFHPDLREPFVGVYPVDVAQFVTFIPKEEDK